jgi:hypothetical protein
MKKQLLNIYYATWSHSKYGGFIPYVCVDFPPDPKQGTIVIEGSELIKGYNGNYEILDYIQNKENWMKRIIEEYEFDFNLFNPKIVNTVVMYYPMPIKPAPNKLHYNIRKDRTKLEQFGYIIRDEDIKGQLERANEILNNKISNVYGRASILLSSMGVPVNKDSTGIYYYPNNGCYGDTLRIKEKQI